VPTIPDRCTRCITGVAVQHVVKYRGQKTNRKQCCAGLEWSATDPWVFASLSYDGRVVVNRVPSQIKYKILI
jgi:hypothetical protein